MNMQGTIQQCVSISPKREILTGLKVHSRLFVRQGRVFEFNQKFKSLNLILVKLVFLGRKILDKKLSPDKGHIKA